MRIEKGVRVEISPIVIIVEYFFLRYAINFLVERAMVFRAYSRIIPTNFRIKSAKFYATKRLLESMIYECSVTVMPETVICM
jgi:hypothetical protein